MTSTKPYGIAKRTVWEAYQQVKANRGAAGIDDEIIADWVFTRHADPKLGVLRDARWMAERGRVLWRSETVGPVVHLPEGSCQENLILENLGLRPPT